MQPAAEGQVAAGRTQAAPEHLRQQRSRTGRQYRPWRQGKNASHASGLQATLRDRVRATTAVLSVGAACMFFLQEVEDRDKLRANVLGMATNLVS